MRISTFYRSVILLIFLTSLITDAVHRDLEQILGFPPIVALWIITFFGPLNIPLYLHEVAPPGKAEVDSNLKADLLLLQGSRTSMISISIGGGLIPLLLALYQFGRVSPIALLVVTLVVAFICYQQSVPVSGEGILLFGLWVAPLMGMVLAMILAPSQAIPVSFAGGVLGVFIGADLLHIRKLLAVNPGTLSVGTSLSIGGAGLFDAIVSAGFLSVAGIYSLSVLL